MSLIEEAIARLEEAGAQGMEEDLHRIYPLKQAAVLESDKVTSIGGGARFEPHSKPQQAAIARDALSDIPVRANVPASGRLSPEVVLPGATKARPGAFSETFELPVARLKEQGFLTPEARATATGREFRMIKGPVLEKAYGTETQRVPNGHRIVVTSALPGEGKTFCAINLAISIAVTGSRRVMLIDADVAQPSVAKHLGIEDRMGLIDLLTGRESDPLKIILQSSIPGLAVMPAGRFQQHAGEYLASQEMSSLMDRLCADYPEMLIIIDTPPLLAVTETRALVQRAGQTLLVVAAGSTKRESVDTALAAVAGYSNISMILNKLPPGRSEFGAYYEY
jgi:protein-tyrosine kinase